MEELLNLLDNGRIYNELLEKFKIEDFSLSIDTHTLTEIVRINAVLQKGYVAINLNGEHVNRYKDNILSDINSTILLDALNDSFLFNPTVVEKDAVINNYVDSIINWRRIPVFIPLLIVGEDTVIVDNSLLFKVPVLPIQVDNVAITANLNFLAMATLVPYISLSNEKVEMCTFNMSHNLIYSPLLPTIVIIKITDETAIKLEGENPKYGDMLINDFVEELISENRDSEGNTTNAFAVSLGMAIKYFLNKE